LATVVAATRQSEETVGTSFKTIFARLSSLSLGETLEDGTNLTKYTAALAKVGISVKDSEGALKSMDQILDELGTKWGSISRE
jgi:TP901 family phage tail tape measure protein